MRRFFYLFWSILLLSASSSHAEQVIQLDPVDNCGLQPSGVVVNLTAGENRFQWIEGAYTYWAFEYAWLTYVDCYIHALDETQYIGLPDYFDTYAQASDAAAGLMFSIWTPVDSPATFFVFDDPCGDNKGNMTFKLLDPPVGVTAAEWGKIKALYR